MLKKEKLQIIRQHYPDAITTADSVEKLFDVLEEQYNLEPSQIMLADNICSDDVNTIEYPARAYEMLGPFKMGGLDEFPFTGLTGMGALRWPRAGRWSSLYLLCTSYRCYQSRVSWRDLSHWSI